MTDTTTQHKPIRKNNVKDQQLCYLMYEGMHYQQRADYKALVQDAQHRCQQCGRTAKQDKNLCMPVAL